jgi:hypothetical protein
MLARSHQVMFMASNVFMDKKNRQPGSLLALRPALARGKSLQPGLVFFTKRDKKVAADYQSEYFRWLVDKPEHPPRLVWATPQQSMR